ncbi:MAG TPA: hypothetical protein VIJ50_10885 [Solirubrobacteraceae bacterium]
MPILFLSSKAQDSERQALIFLGGTGVLAKPIDPPSFPGEVARILTDASSENRDGGSS